MSQVPHHILIIGCGSIGERHLRTFLATKRARITACDNRPAIRQQMTEKYGVPAVADWQAALADPSITGAVIAMPAPLHVPAAIKLLDSGRHVLIEKPLALDLTGTDQLIEARNRSRRHAVVAYVYHTIPSVKAAREFLLSPNCPFGPIKHVAVSNGQHFPTYRPAYREIYYRDHAQGGGAIQDALTHLANAVEWVLGPTKRVYCDADHQVLEGVTVEDTVNVAARNGGAMVNYALTQFQAPNESRIDFHCDTGSVRVEVHNQRWGTIKRGDSDWTWHAAPVAERDTLFIAQANAFLDGCEGRPQDLCSLEEGIQTLRFNIAALKSWRTGQAVVP
ncbi:MAG: Gfo/Idh/MocA family oxidoreductase [Opitutaceae bacterium]|nr:Gfo/Idh/MocA family oxidoreductase [Opitutaceae bacterium]